MPGFINTAKVERACSRLDHLESQRVRFSSQEQPEDFKSKLAAAERFQKRADLSCLASKNSKHALCQRIVGLKYRLGKENGGINPHKKSDKELLSQLTEHAKTWKSREIGFEGKTFTKNDLRKLKEACRYTRFARLLLKDPILRKRFFKWCLQNKHPIEIFIEFPATAKKIYKCLLEGRLSAVKGLHIGIENGKKDVFLRTEDGSYYSILKKDKKIPLSDGLVLTVKEIFAVFKKKNFEEGSLTILGKGVSNWDPHKFGRRDGETGKIKRINLKRKDWYKQLKVREHISRKEAKKRFSPSCDGKKWIVTLIATRQSRELTMTGAHSYLEFAIPRGDGTYDCTYGISKFPTKYPKNFFQVIKAFFQYSTGTLEYPDNNEFYTHRQRRKLHFVISARKAERLMESIRKDLIRSKKGNLPFQYLVDNCTHWCVNKVKKYVSKDVDKLFAMDFVDLEPGGILGKMCKVLRKAPAKFRNFSLYSFCFVFGGQRSKVFLRKDGSARKLSLLKNAPWKRSKGFIHPGIVFKKLEERGVSAA